MRTAKEYRRIAWNAIRPHWRVMLLISLAAVLPQLIEFFLQNPYRTLRFLAAAGSRGRHTRLAAYLPFARRLPAFPPCLACGDCFRGHAAVFDGSGEIPDGEKTYPARVRPHGNKPHYHGG